MSSTTFYRKYRPQKFSDVIGQKHIVTTLTNALKMGKVGHAYLLTGPRGTGKTTLARLFAKAINCSKRKQTTAEACNTCPHCLLVNEGRSFDIIEIDAASHTGVDNIRELRETVALPPSLGSHKIYIIDEVHMLSIGAWNALLKTLEEPPAHVVFILATTALHKVPETILSRCQRFDLTRFPLSSLVTKLAHIAKAEKIDISKDAINMIAHAAEGGMRDAESLLMQVVSLGTTPITEETIALALGTTKREHVTTLVRLVGEKRLFESLTCVRELSANGADLSLFASLLLHLLRDILIINTNPKQGPTLVEGLTDEQKEELGQLAQLFTPEELLRALECFQIAQRDSKTAVIPELPLEIAIVKILSETNHDAGIGNHETSSGRGTLNPESKVPAYSSGEKKQESKITESTPTKKESKIENQESQVEDRETKGEDTVLETMFDLAHIKDRWASILDTAKRLNASLSIGLSTARPIETTGSTIVIAVKYPFHKERLEEQANRLTLEKAFDTILGTKTKLVIRVEDAKSTASAGLADHNPLISEALSMLGGRVVTEN